MENIENKHRPAYPLPVAGCNDGGMYTVGEKDFQSVGLSKREMFAAMALQGLLGFSHEENVPNLDNVSYCAKIAVIAADELLKQLEL